MTSKKCCHCDRELIGQIPTGHAEDIPVEGDILLCPFCYEINVYNDKLELSKPTQEFLDSMPQQYKDMIQEFVIKLKKKYGPDIKLN